METERKEMEIADIELEELSVKNLVNESLPRRLSFWHFVVVSVIRTRPIYLSLHPKDPILESSKDILFSFHFCIFVPFSASVLLLRIILIICNHIHFPSAFSITRILFLFLRPLLVVFSVLIVHRFALFLSFMVGMGAILTKQLALCACFTTINACLYLWSDSLFCVVWHFSGGLVRFFEEEEKEEMEETAMGRTWLPAFLACTYLSLQEIVFFNVMSYRFNLTVAYLFAIALVVTSAVSTLECFVRFSSNAFWVRNARLVKTR